MVINNKLDGSFGKVGLASGLLLIVAGIISIIFTTGWTVVLIILGAFISFTHSGTQIDTNKKKIRLYQNICGVIKTGKWYKIESFKGVTVTPFNRITQMRSFSNQQTTLEEHDFRIFILNKKVKPVYPIKKCKTKEEALHELDELALLLQLPVFSILND